MPTLGDVQDVMYRVHLFWWFYPGTVDDERFLREYHGRMVALGQAIRKQFGVESPSLLASFSRQRAIGDDASERLSALKQWLSLLHPFFDHYFRAMESSG